MAWLAEAVPAPSGASAALLEGETQRATAASGGVGGSATTCGGADAWVIVKDATNQTRTLTGQFTDQNPTAWVELPLPAPMNVKEISISGQSGESWIALWEVMYRSCAP